MFKKVQRLTRQKDFDRVYATPVVGRSRLMSLRAPKNNLGIRRFAVVVGGKVSKKATERNRIKRQLRGILEERTPSLPVGRDYLVLVYPTIKDADSSEIRQVLIYLLDRVRSTKTSVKRKQL